jgi:hypothetical protein
MFYLLHFGRWRFGLGRCGQIDFNTFSLLHCWGQRYYMPHHIGNLITFACFGRAAFGANQGKEWVVVVGADWARPAAAEG